MALSLNLNKAEKTLRLCLQKSGISQAPPVDVAFVLDVSGSFHDEHQGGQTNTLLTRLVPWGMTFDPDRKMDVFTFSAGERSAHHVGEVNADNCEGYIAREIINRVPGYGAGTEYSPVLEAVLRRFGWLTRKPGLLQRLLGQAAPATATTAKRPSLVIFVTDGDNSDHARTRQLLAESSQRQDAVYFLFIGISNQGGKFPFLKRIGAEFNNTGLHIVRQLGNFVKQSDEELSTLLLQPELLTWLKAR